MLAVQVNTCNSRSWCVVLVTVTSSSTHVRIWVIRRNYSTPGCRFRLDTHRCPPMLLFISRWPILCFSLTLHAQQTSCISQHCYNKIAEHWIATETITEVNGWRSGSNTTPKAVGLSVAYFLLKLSAKDGDKSCSCRWVTSIVRATKFSHQLWSVDCSGLRTSFQIMWFTYISKANQCESKSSPPIFLRYFHSRWTSIIDIFLCYPTITLHV